MPKPRVEPKPARPSLAIVHHDGTATEEVQAGDALVIRARGLAPSTLYSVVLTDEAGEISTQSIMSDRDGVVLDAVVWPQVGIDDPRDREPTAVAEARKQWLGRQIDVALRDGKEKGVGKARVTVSATAEPLAVATDREGRLLNGFEVGDHDATLSLLDFGKGGNLRVWMVPRQHAWRTGDRIRPARLARGRPAQVDVDLEGAEQRVVIGKAADLVSGVYDFVIRRVRYGYEDDDDLIVRASDVIVGRWATGLVVRERFMQSKVILGGCANLQQIACRRTLGGMWPYVQFTDTFQVGEDVWGTLDPNALDPTHTGKAAAIYIVPHKTAAQWTADNSLSHLAVLGGNPATQKWITQSWCTNANLHLLWPNATQVGDYDVVVDFGNDSATLAGFMPDDQYNMPLDIIDGYIVPGFRIVPDPTVDTSFSNVGAFSYDSSTQGSVTVTGDSGGSFTVPLSANVRFPADAPGATSPAQISAAQPSYPVVVLVHGNSSHINSYQGYDYLLDHLAQNGFIAVSIHMQPGQQGTDRARVLQSHLPIIFGMFGTHAANNVGLMGHSRGGEAVVIATRLNQQEGWGWNINAVVSLAPTNQYTSEHFGGAWAEPYLVIYGSLDGDLGGIGDTGFELYDHASGMNKSMAFVYRACHDRFNTVWGDGDFFFGEMTPTDQAAVISANSHQLIAKGYMTAFFRQELKAEGQWAGIFRGEWVPAAVTASDANMRIYTQYEDTTVRTVDDFEGAHTATSWQSSTINPTVGSVSQSGLPATPSEGDLRTLDPQSPHLTAGLVLRWDNNTDSLDYAIPAGQRDVSAFQAVSFRVSQKVNSASNPANQPQDLRLTLTDGGGHSRAIRVSKLAEIPYPYIRGFASLVKSAMCTIRIPLAAYHIHCYNVDQVDLTDVTNLSFQFAEKVTGEIEVDSIQFTN
jgi:hypothetical protein